VKGHASYSSVTSWSECGLKYKLTRLDGFAEQPAWWSVGGSAVHQATEWWDIGAHQELDTEGLFGQALTDQVAKECKFSDTPPSEWRSSRGQDRDWWMDNGPGMVQAWIDWREQTAWQILEIDNPDGDPLMGEPSLLGVELPFEIELGGMPVKGYIDRVFVTPAGETVIVDLKTGARKPASPLQLGFYRAAVMEQYGVTADLGGYFMNRKKPGEQFVVEGLAQYTPDYVGQFVSGFKQAREVGLYLPHVTALCKSCGVARHCWAQNPELAPGVSGLSTQSDVGYSHSSK
jgi:hypothetical protein